MSKVRIGHEVIFIDPITESDNIPEKYHFDFNHKYIAYNSETKRIAVRKIKVYQTNLTPEIGYAIDDPEGTQQKTEFHYA
jgi:hypothetical protein